MRHDASDEADINAGGRDDGEAGFGTWRVPNHSRRGRGMDPANKKLALIALGVSAAVGLGIGAYSMTGHHSGVVPVIEADSRPIRVKPENPGGLQVSGANDEILSDDAGPAASRLAPPAEAPEPNALRASQQAQLTKSAGTTASGPSVSEAHPTPAGPAEKRAVAVPVAPPAVPPGVPSPAQPVASAPVQAAPVQAPAAKSTLVQFAALGTEQAARAEWSHLNKRIPDLLGGRQPSFSKIEHDGKVFWRVRTGGFSDMAQATSFCERARAKGAACTIASF